MTYSQRELLSFAAADTLIAIFETNQTIGAYSVVANIVGDTGGLSYGKHMASLKSGGVPAILVDYRERGGSLAGEFDPYMAALLDRDLEAFPKNHPIENLLERAGRDPIMRQVQDDFFWKGYMLPAIMKCEEYGFIHPLSFCVIYDSSIHSGTDWHRKTFVQELNAELGPPSASNEMEWVKEYLLRRGAWLRSLLNAAKTTDYRTRALHDLAERGCWDLALPLTLNIQPQGQSAYQRQVTSYDMPTDLKGMALFNDPLFRTESFEPYLPLKRRGGLGVSSGLDAHIQECLVHVDCLTNTAGDTLGPLDIDGKFGRDLEASVRKFQQTFGVTGDTGGVVGVATYAALKQAVIDIRNDAQETEFVDVPVPRGAASRSAENTVVAAGTAGAGIASTASEVERREDLREAQAAETAPETAAEPAVVTTAEPVEDRVEAGGDAPGAETEQAIGAEAAMDAAPEAADSVTVAEPGFLEGLLNAFLPDWGPIAYAWIAVILLVLAIFLLARRKIQDI